MRLISPEFENNQHIPERFTCVGYDINPELLIEDIPHGAKSLALTVHDPDSRYGTWVHWIVYDIPVVSRIYEESVPGTQGMNSFEKLDYGGPCPTTGTHRYVFTVYALDEKLNLKEGLTLDELQNAMQGHILAQAELTGLYKKPPVPAGFEKIRI